jgi:hypothetical protein
LVGSSLGFFQLEKTFEKGIFMAPKTLIVKSNGVEYVTFKGIPNEVQKKMSFESFYGFYTNLKYDTTFVKAVVKNTANLEIRSELSTYKTNFKLTKRAKLFDKTKC